MRFSRSVRRHPEWPALFQKQAVAGYPRIESEALHTPARLKERIIAGHSPLELWLSREEQSLHDPQIAEKFDLFPHEFQREIQHIEEPFLTLSAESLLDYCETIGVHPAHLIPLDDDPRLSLPVNILKANMLILKDGMSTAEENDLALAALAVERKRYTRLLHDKSFQKNNKIEGVSKLLERALKHQFDKKVDDIFEKTSGLGGFFAANYDAIFNRAALMIDMFVVRKDNSHLAIANRFQESARELKEANTKAYEAYEKIFGDIEYDLQEKADEVYNRILGYLKFQPKDFEKVNLRGCVRIIKEFKGKEIKLMENASAQWGSTPEMSLLFPDYKFQRLADAYIEKMKSSCRYEIADTDMKEDGWDYEDTVDDYRFVASKLHKKEFSYIGRLFANHKIVTDVYSSQTHETEPAKMQMKMS